MTIIKRADLGRPLTWDELDDNFRQVDNLTAAASAAVSSAAASATAAAGSATNSLNSANSAAASALDALNSSEVAINALMNSTFEPSSFDFTSGGTLDTSDRNKAVYNPADNNWYSWSGTLPHVVTTGTDPTTDSNWKPRTDQLLREDLASSSGASEVGLSQGGTVQDGIYWLTPEMFGAKGDAVVTASGGVTGTDDTAAIQAAINAAKNKTLVFSNGKKYRTKNLTVPHPMTFLGLGRRQDGAIVPYGNVPAESFVHSGTLISLTTSGTVTFYDLTVDARNIPLSAVDGQRLTGVGVQDNTSGVYQSGFMMFNCNVSGFSGNNIYGGASKSFGILKDCQSESSGKSCVRIDGVDWRIDHCYVGRSTEGHGIEVLNENNAITNCDVYFNKLSGVFYQQPTGMAFIKISCNTINSNGQHGISISLPYPQPAGTIIAENIFWNNSTEITGTYNNIDLNYGRGHIVVGNVHKAYQATDGSSSARCAYCVNLRNGATLSGPLMDAIDPLYSYISGVMNVTTQSIFNQNEFTVGTGTIAKKLIASDTSTAYEVWIPGEAYPRLRIVAGKIYLGNGSADSTHGIQQLAAYPNVTMGIKGLGVVGNYKDSPLRIGTFRLWSGGDNTIRSKFGADPTSATDGFVLSMKVDVPATATSTGIAGQWAADTGYLYVCVAANTWRRTSIAAW